MIELFNVVVEPLFHIPPPGGPLSELAEITQFVSTTEVPAELLIPAPGAPAATL